MDRKSESEQRIKAIGLEIFQQLRQSLEARDKEAFTEYEKSMEELRGKFSDNKTTLEFMKKRAQNSLNRVLELNKKLLAQFVDEFNITIT